MIRLLRPFTPVKAKIAAGIAAGLPYATIAKGLTISPATVRSHVRQMAVILDAGDLGELPPLVLVRLWCRQEQRA